MANKHWFLGRLALALGLGLVLAACGGATPAAQFKYELSGDGKGIVITEYTGSNQNVVIPSKIQGLPVVKLRRCFDNHDSLVSVVIPASVKEIGGSVFRGQQNLASVTIKGSGVVVGLESFGACRMLNKLVFPDGKSALIPDPDENRPKPNGDYMIDIYTAFYGNDRLPEATKAKLRAMGFSVK